MPSVRTIASVAAGLYVLTAGTSLGQVVANFQLSSTVEVDLMDDNGIVSGNGSFSDAGTVLFATGDTTEAASFTGFRFAGTTSGGVDDPTRRSSASLEGSLATPRGGPIRIDLAAGLRLVDAGEGTLAMSVLFNIDNTTGPVPFQIIESGPGFSGLSAVTGTIFPNGTLGAGSYQVSFFSDAPVESAWSLVIPAPGAGAALAAGLLLTARRRR
jgi:hypothetical protein